MEFYCHTRGDRLAWQTWMPEAAPRRFHAHQPSGLGAFRQTDVDRTYQDL